MAKKSFAMDTTSLSTERPLLDNGVYAGVIRNAGCVMGQSSTIEVVKERTWDRNSRTWSETGNYTIQGSFRFGVTLTSKKAIQILQRDEPIVFGGQIDLRFTEGYQMQDNVILGQFLAALGLAESWGEFNDTAVSGWEYDENIEVPEELANVENIVDMLNSVAYYRSLFELVSNAVNGMQCQVKVVKQPNYKTPEVLENVIDRGTGNARFCGILAYTDGAEFDLGE